MAQIKKLILTRRSKSYTRSLACLTSFCFAKDPFQNMEFSHLKYRLKRKQIDIAPLQSFS